MQFQVTDIEFDFEDDYDEAWQGDPVAQQDIIDDYVGTIWEADDGDDLVDEITCAAGWCIKSIDYRIILDDIDMPEHEVEFDIDYTTQS